MLLTSRIVAEANPDTLGTANCYKRSPVSSSYILHSISEFDRGSGIYDIQNGTEQVTFPVNEFSWLHDGVAAPVSTEGTRNVSALRVSISNTLLDS